jgi:hypothetical protein
MPFRSERQRRFLWANHPDLARRWTDKYGSRPMKGSDVVRVNVKDLVDAIEIAIRLSVSPDAVWKWARERGDFPDPVVDKGRYVKLWLWPDVLAWARENEKTA